MRVVSCCLAAGRTSLGHPGKCPLPLSEETQGAPQAAKCPLCPTCSSFSSLLFSRRLLGTLPAWQLGRGCTDLLVILQGYFHLHLNPPGCVSSHVNQWTSLSPSIIFVCVLCSPSTDCFGNATFMNAKEFGAVVCYTHMREEGNAPCSTAAEETPASSSDQKTLLWEKQVPACRVRKEQEGLGLWKLI